MKNKKKFEIMASFILCPKCRKKHAFHEYPLDNIKLCETCAGSHTTKYFPSLIGLKLVHEGENQTLEKPYYVATRRSWKTHQSDMMQDLNSRYAQQSQNNWKTPSPWKPWTSQSQPQN